MTHKKYRDIERIKLDLIDNFYVGDTIYIEEKIDGANCSIQYDTETDSIVASSRKQILTPINNLRGFYEFAHRLDKEEVKDILGENLILFGEWLIPHSVPYPDEKYNQMYAFDVYDRTAESYLPQETAVKIAEKLKIPYVPIFYVGEFVSWQHCREFVGKTNMGGEYGEGIVVKNVSRLHDDDNRKPVYLKIVAEKFAETKSHRNRVREEKTPEQLQAIAENQALAETIVTKARVQKFLHKFVDEGILPENWGAREMAVIAKNLGKALIEDCMKEEPDTVAKVENFGKIANSLGMKFAKKILAEREGF